MFSIFINMKQFITIILLLATTNFSAQYLDLWDSDACQYETTTYHDNGNIKESGCLDNQKRKVGTWTYYSIEGTKIAKLNFNEHGLKHGEWLIWDDQGVLRTKMEYTNGTRIGIWQVWNASGVLVNERIY